MIDSKVLEELLRCGAVGMDVEKSCAIVEITEEEFYASAEAQKAYRTGQYKGEYTWRQAVFKGAKDGIPQMCKLFQSLIQDMVILNNPDLEIDIEDYYQCNYEIDNKYDNQGAGGGPDTRGEPESDPSEDSENYQAGMPDELRRDD